ncbi:hypothetical protein B9Z37_12020 [Limnohabitans parvus II-B4]|uniref:Uncharacterized protein n=1 Tax=Limnohabitans parvus II-B4 TaxID=1293052 RepID=A0A315FID5_9BURK|nr:hypothetical protein B9Z37_12020 [Limnohabitans parvus II-B4]
MGPCAGAQRRFALPHRPRTGPQLTCGGELKKAGFAAFFNFSAWFFLAIFDDLGFDFCRVQRCLRSKAHALAVLDTRVRGYDRGYFSRQTSRHLAWGEAGAEPGDLASEASYEPGQRLPQLRRFLQKLKPGLKSFSP